MWKLTVSVGWKWRGISRDGKTTGTHLIRALGQPINNLHTNIYALGSYYLFGAPLLASFCILTMYLLYGRCI